MCACPRLGEISVKSILSGEPSTQRNITEQEPLPNYSKEEPFISNQSVCPF